MVLAEGSPLYPTTIGTLPSLRKEVLTTPCYHPQQGTFLAVPSSSIPLVSYRRLKNTPIRGEFYFIVLCHKLARKYLQADLENWEEFGYKL
jgi:hypothetical protein